MSSPESAPEPKRRPPGAYSPDCIDVDYDGPSNARGEPLPPGYLESLRAEREKMMRYGAIPTPPKADGTAAPQPGAAPADGSPIRVPLDDALLRRLHGLRRPVELIDANGRVVAVVLPSQSGEGQAGS